MKHSFLTLIALLMSISYAFAGTHTVYFYDDPDEPAIQSIVDQTDFVYELNEYGYSQYTIADGTTLTFTMNDPTKIIYCIDEMTFEEIAMGYTFTINSSMPNAISFSAGDPYAVVEVKVYGACEAITGIKINGMDRVEDFCTLHEDGYYYIRIPDLYEGDEVKLTSSVDIDWGEYGGVGKTGTIPVTEVTPEPIRVIGTDVWNDNDHEHYTATVPGPLTITYTGRTIYADMWNPICFPFNIKKEKMEQIFGVNTVVQYEGATFSESAGLIVECSYVTEGMKANTPYLVKPNADITGNIKFEDVGVQNFEAKTLQTEGSNVKFVGTVRPVVLAENDKTKLFIGKSNVVYYPAEDVTIKGFRAYFEIPSGVLSVQGRKPGTARFIIRDRKAPTGVENNVMNTKNATKYMQNGRLVIENNGVRYNAQGMQLD